MFTTSGRTSCQEAKAFTFVLTSKTLCCCPHPQKYISFFASPNWEKNSIYLEGCWHLWATWAL